MTAYRVTFHPCWGSGNRCDEPRTLVITDRRGLAGRITPGLVTRLLAAILAFSGNLEWNDAEIIAIETLGAATTTGGAE